ncbi:hypothetical protein [Gemmata obscuriglobus]|nr:hypothetical protein [Gemmata obscuriglobus]
MSFIVRQPEGELMGWRRRLLGQRPDAGEPPRPPAPHERFGVVAGLADGAVFGAGFSPGFTSDLTCWRLWFYLDGRVRQELRVSTPDNNYVGEPSSESRTVGPEVPAGLVAAAGVAGLAGLDGWYGADCTDLCTVSVAALLPGGVRAVEVYGPFDMAGRGHAGAGVVLGLWLSAVRFAPRRPEWLAVADAEPGAAPDTAR